ncbi:type IV pilus biogenesis/stability protein PilW [Azoarcus olearius]|uniref:Type 4 pilus biogenesis protein n=1 Tax=Azoarcus sp. (strain BH72) TaxID=418699 RepID=A1K3Y7_AZOSB|nr:type IV pilus biogenesis/stability protein PilW [Azoarcus olearius]ANQ84064.1 putative type 4 pilus biogenesis protein [Azoarcus olearius]CAL93542.1 putative type 4 pilus biogenesis protein [Azoarcus olearius]
MARKAASLLLMMLALSGCVTSTTRPGPAVSSGSGTGASRPLSELPPSSEAESRAKVHVDLGIAYFDVGRNDVALDEAAIALHEKPGYAPAYHLRALVYMAIDDVAAARENFQAALSAAPGDPDFNNSYGWFLCQQGREQEGLEHLARAARNPYYRYPTRPYNNAGLCHLRLGQDAAAEAQFVRAVQADPQNGEALFQLATLAYRRGDLEAARGHLVRLHQMKGPTAASAWLGLRTERRLGNRDAEASYAAQLRSRFSKSPEFQLMSQGKYE